VVDPIDLVDPALRRPERFDEEIEIGLPDREDRFEILKIHIRVMPLAENVDLNKLADFTDGYTGAELMALCKRAAMKSLRRLPREALTEDRIPDELLDGISVTMEDFLDAIKEFRRTGCS